MSKGLLDNSRAGQVRSKGATHGTTFVELVVAISIVAIALMVMLQQLSLSHQEEQLGKKTVSAYEKALGMLSELQSSIERDLIRDAVMLDGYDDQGIANPLLTTLGGSVEPLAPEHPMSGNEKRQGQWRWARMISVQGIPGSEQMRYVRILVQARDNDGKLRTKASVSGVLNLAGPAEPSVKHYDVYVLAVSSAPSSWLPIPAMRALFQTASDRLSADNAGLDFELHWISRFGYGRDEDYAPFVNRSRTADSAAPWTYWYPGRLAERNRASVLFDPDLFTGRVIDEKGVLHGFDAEHNPLPHAVADQWNHCKRLPAARVQYAQRLAAGLETESEPPLQLLLADMWEDPDRYRNAIIVNLHGEGLPFPPMRNYSDAAKVPLRQPGVRVVTHPARLWTPRDPDSDGDHSDSEDLELRVYAYKEDPSVGDSVLPEVVTIEIMGVDLTADVNAAVPTLEIRRLVGGVNVTTGLTSGSGREYASFGDPQGLASVRTSSNPPFEMEYEVGFATLPYPRTWIRLYNTPLVTPSVALRGLRASERLYGFDYIPSPVLNTGDFDVDLATDMAQSSPRNTARWRIRIPKTVFASGFGGATGGLSDQDTVLRVTTRIGTDTTTGQRWPLAHEAANQSQTYAWWTGSSEAVPLTERYQILGDPRHNPYLDLCAGTGPLAHGYNWFFDSLETTAHDARSKWSCLDGGRLRDGYVEGVPIDVPRAMQVWRQAMTSSEVVLSNAGGSLGKVLLLGGEIALPRSGAALEPSPVILAGEFFGVTGTVHYDAVSPEPQTGGTGAAAPGGETSAALLRGRALVLEQTSGGFWAKPWLGELAPDKSAFEYQADGNLMTSGEGITFRRELRSRAVLSDLPLGTDFDYPSGSLVGSLGAASLLQIGSASVGFSLAPQPSGLLAELSEAGAGIMNASGMGAVLGSSVRLPYGFNETLHTNLSQVAYPEIYPMCFAQELEVFATATLGSGATMASSGVVRLYDPSGNRSFVSLIGETPETRVDHERLARRSLLFAVRSFHVAGEPVWNNNVDQIPQVHILAPVIDKTLDRPVAVSLRWRTEFLRFDGQPYTERYTATAGEGEDRLCYHVIASRDNGQHWFYPNTGESAIARTRPATGLLLDSGIGDESLVITTEVPLFPEGEYLLRVECYHRTRSIMSSSHQVRFRIKR